MNEIFDFLEERWVNKRTVSGVSGVSGVGRNFFFWIFIYLFIYLFFLLRKKFLQTPDTPDTPDIALPFFFLIYKK